ncbi:MAG: hypothetical protein HY290_20585 [Planctomycetia bacterium]|nr:hypothetical protein [Planctomycetia bacterium]
MSRKNREEEHFGSDSFLDVLANIVGILIILIVSAAARVQRGTETAAAVPVVTTPEAVLTEIVAVAAAPVEPPPELEPDEIPTDIAEDLALLEQTLAALDAKSRAADAELKKLRANGITAAAELDSEQRAAAERNGKLKQSQVRLARLEEALGERQGALRGLLAEFEEAENARSPAIEVKHRLAPVSQEVTGDEVHFRLSGGRVAVVPIDQLAERMKAQLERQKDWLATRGRHEAVVGPIDGFTMKFEVERKALSTMDRHRYGYGAYRIGVSHWEVVPDPALADESAEEALRRGSRFSLAVRTAPERATLTFWVYPDSFHAYRILQAACQAEGFVVAARPLPEGIGIAGSPDGTRSAGQ